MRYYKNTALYFTCRISGFPSVFCYDIMHVTQLCNKGYFMKRILLRFESKSGTILWLSVVAIVFGFVSGIAFFDGVIAVGCIFAIICAGLIAALLYFAFRKEVIIDFKHNLFKMKAGIKKEQCALDQVKNLEIVFRWVKKMDCYSAQILACLKDGKTISVKIYPRIYRSYRYRLADSVWGRVTERLKRRVERQVSGYDFITCRTKTD